MSGNSIGSPKERLLRALARYPYLSAPQATRYLFSRGSLTYVREHLRQLHVDGYVQRVPLMPRNSAAKLRNPWTDMSE